MREQFNNSWCSKRGREEGGIEEEGENNKECRKIEEENGKIEEEKGKKTDIFPEEMETY